jgi:CheY-like chemotaxis protein
MPGRYRGSTDPLRDCVILYVEDDDATAYLFQLALNESGRYPNVFRVTDGEQALSFLHRTGSYEEAPRPDLVLLDLNLPKKSGFDVLFEIRRSETLRGLLVVVFSSSTLPYDREKAINLGTDKYLTKQGDLESFTAAVRSLCEMLTPRPVLRSA